MKEGVVSDSSMDSCKVEEVKVGVESGSNMASLVEEVMVVEENGSSMAS